MLIFFRTENLPFPATAVTNDTKRRFRSRIASGEKFEKCQLAICANTKHRSPPSRCRKYHRDSHSNVIMTDRIGTIAPNTTYLLVLNPLRVFPSSCFRRMPTLQRTGGAHLDSLKITLVVGPLCWFTIRCPVSAFLQYPGAQTFLVCYLRLL